MRDSSITSAEQTLTGFKLPPLPDEVEEEENQIRVSDFEFHCDISEKFGAWGIDALHTLRKSPTDAAINTLKVQLLDTYIDWCKLLPKRCRNYKGTHSDAKCIPQLLEYIGESIREIANMRSPVVMKEPAEIIREKPIYQMGGAPVGIRSGETLPKDV